MFDDRDRLPPFAPPDELDDDTHRLKYFLYLIPVMGVIPALWTLSHRENTTKRQRNLSRLAITLAAGWITGYALLGFGAQTSELLEVPLLITNSVFTSGYFVLNLFLMVKLLKRQSLDLPGISQIRDRIL